MISLKTSEWVILSCLLLLSFVPCVGGIFRLMELGNGTSVLPENPRVLAAPLPVIVHLLGSIPYTVLGILQFLPGVRNAFPRWHRRSGRLLLVLGFLAAFSGLWMTHFYDFPAELQGPLLYWVRVFVGIGMIASLGLGISSVLKKRIATHLVWMTRAYALAQGAGTQVLTVISWTLMFGEPVGLTRDILMTLSWVINLCVAEAFIRRSKKDTSTSL